MDGETLVCAAALFRNRGKDIITQKEFTMYISLDLRWMGVKEADKLRELLLDEGILKKNGDMLKPAGDLSEIDVPVAYKPSSELLEMLRTWKIPAKKRPEKDSMLNTLMEVAVENGIQKRTFVKECNDLVKHMNIHMEAAALIILREHGVDPAPYTDGVTDCIRAK